MGMSGVVPWQLVLVTCVASDRSYQEVTGATLEGDRLPRDTHPAPSMEGGGHRCRRLPMGGDHWECGGKHCLWVDVAAFAMCVFASWLLLLFLLKATSYKLMSMFCTVISKSVCMWRVLAS